MKINQFIYLSILLIFSTSCYVSKEKSQAVGWQNEGYASQGDADFALAEVEYSQDKNEVQLGNVSMPIETRKVVMEDGFESKSDTDKKVIFNGSMTLSVKNIDSTSNQLEAIAKKYEGYASEIGTYRTTIRVKSAMVKEAMKDIGELGYVQNKRLSGNDVTNEYLDFQIRLDNAVKARERYLQLLEKAENVEAALLVEKELERLNGTIDIIKGNMNRINHLSEFSTITVNINEKKKPGILGYIGIGIYRSVKWLFVRN